MTERYQDYVIKDGKYIGDFENMYLNCEDPWLQSDAENVYDSRRIIAQKWIQKLAIEREIRVCEIGCGFGHMTAQLTKSGIDCIGTDISETAVAKAKLLHPESKFSVSAFNDFSFYRHNKINVFLMSEITWYILPELNDFLEDLKNYKEEFDKPIYLLHLLSTYAPGIQKYGSEYFTNLEEIMNFFALEKYLEYGSIFVGKENDKDSRGTYFIGTM